METIVAAYWLSDEELAALTQVPINAQIIYLRGLRPRMADNGVVGYGKRALGWQDLAALFPQDMSRKQVRTQLDHLKNNQLAATPNTSNSRTNSIFLKLPLANAKGPAKGPLENVAFENIGGTLQASCPQMAAYSEYPEMQRGQQKGHYPQKATKQGPAKGPLESAGLCGLEAGNSAKEGQQKGHIINQYLINNINTSSIKRWAEQRMGIQLTDDDVVLLDQAVSNLALSNKFFWRADDLKHQLSLVELVILERATPEELTAVRLRAESFVKGDRWQVQYAHNVLRSIRQEIPTQSVSMAPIQNDPTIELKDQARELSQEIAGLEQLGGEEVAEQIREKRQALTDIGRQIDELTGALC
jgi:hypothetical protein